MYVEAQLDSLVGPTHNFAGMAPGNLASIENQGISSSPKKAALQGIEKMRIVAKHGGTQLFLPPQKRPLYSFLKRLGFEKTEKAFIEAPDILLAAFSSSYMWVANAGTSTPSIDTLDRKHHLTPANLGSNLHRHLEVYDTTRHLQKVFGNLEVFNLHSSLPSVLGFFDEGAANQTRLCPSIDMPALHLFVYGGETVRFPARQSKRASETIVRIHRLPKERVILLEQNPEVIDQGVFHNDVISMGNLNLFISHERAFKDKGALDLIASTFKKFYRRNLQLQIVREDEISVEKAVKTYFFNSQILTPSFGHTILLAPKQCEDDPVVKKYIEKLPYFSTIEYISLDESMKNGGGPACLRLRVVLNEKELKSIPNRYRMDEKRAELISIWIEKNYPDLISIEDFKNKAFLDEIEHIYLNLELFLDKLS